MNFILVGPPGSGKGTVSHYLKSVYNIPSLSTGSILRSEIKKGTELGFIAQNLIDNGKFVPDELVVQIIRNFLYENENGYALDGFPRNLNQAKLLDDLLSQNHQKIDGVLILHTPYSVLLQRILDRLVCSNCGASFNRTTYPPKVAFTCDYCQGVLERRKDDEEALFSVRFKTYIEQTEPIISFYTEKGITIEIETDKTVHEIYQDIDSVMQKR